MRVFTIAMLFCSVSISFSQVSLVYGPFLQMGGQTSMIVAWRTDQPCDSKVKFGVSKSSLNFSNSDATPVAHHTIAISGLSPNTKYFYTVQNNALSFNCDTFFFYTAPPNNSKQKLRMVVTGDCGSGLPAQVNTRNALMNHIGNNYVNCWLILGDNAYTNGLDAEYTNLFFAPYQDNFIMHHSCLYPCPGNHDYANNATLQASKAIPYYDIFCLPAAGELGGFPSGSESYYSFNYGNIHFVSIDSYGVENSLRLYDTLSPQFQWLKQDLAQNNSMWTILYWHHPPYSMGTHNSDTEAELVNIRKYITPMIESYKVDLVLNGHSHNYERSWLMKGHTGLESSFSKLIHVKDSSSARYNGTPNSCPYLKDTIGNKGVVYTVCGSSGWPQYATQPSYPHDAMYYSNSGPAIAGYLEVEDNHLAAFFLGEDSVIHDQYHIFKNVHKNKIIHAAPQQTFVLSASWPGTYYWSNNGATTMQNTITAGNSTLIYVRDSLNCLADTFKIFVNVGLPEFASKEPSLFPNPVNERFLHLSTVNMKPSSEIYLTDLSGREYKITKFQFNNNDLTLQLPDVKDGQYTLRILSDEKILAHKIIIRSEN